MRSLLRYEQLQLMAQRLLDQFCHDDPRYRSRAEDIPSVLSLILDVAGAVVDDQDTSKQNANLWRSVAMHSLYEAFRAGPDQFQAARTRKQQHIPSSKNK
jgi:hypothetical protein